MGGNWGNHWIQFPNRRLQTLNIYCLLFCPKLWLRLGNNLSNRRILIFLARILLLVQRAIIQSMNLSALKLCACIWMIGQFALENNKRLNCSLELVTFYCKNNCCKKTRSIQFRFTCKKCYGFLRVEQTSL